MGIVIPTRNKESTLDKVAKGLAVANAGLGIASNIQSIRKSGAEMDKMEKDTDLAAMKRRHENALSQKQVGDYVADGAKVVPAGTEGARTFSVAKPDGGVEDVGLIIPMKKDPTLEAAKIKAAAEAKEPKDVQYKAALFGKRMEQAENDYQKVMGEGFDRTSNWSGLASILPGAVQPDQSKRAEQAEINFTTAVLRPESGAVIGEEEMKRDRAKYFPRTGDSPELVKQKAALRALALQGIKAEAGKAWGKYQAGPVQLADTKSPPVDHKQFTLNGKTFGSVEELQKAAQAELQKRSSQKAVVAR